MPPLKKHSALVAILALLVVGVLLLLRWTGDAHDEGLLSPGKELAPDVEQASEVLATIPRERVGRAAAEERTANVGSPVARPLGPGGQAPAALLGSVRVEVREAGTGKPAAGIVVELIDHTAFENGAAMMAQESLLTQDAGVALFEGLNPGKVTVTAHAAIAGEGKNSAVLTVKLGETTAAAFEVDETQHSVGYVEDLGGQRIGGAEIWNIDAGIAGHVVAISGADGSFEVPYLRPRSHLSASRPGYAPSAPRVVGVLGGPNEVLVLKLSSRRGRVFGRTVDERGAGIADAQLTLMRQGRNRVRRVLRTVSASDGAFEFADVMEADHYLAGQFEGGAVTQVEVSVTSGGQHEHVVELRRGGTVSGQVTGSDGAPYPGVMVLIWGALSSQLGATYVRADEEGRFEFAGQVPGEVTYYVTNDGGREVAKATLVIINGQTTEWNPVAIEPPVFHGTLLSSAGRPLGGWRVAVQPSKGPDAYDSWVAKKVDDQGRFEVNPEAGSTYRIHVYAPGVSGKSNFALEREDVDPNANPLDLVVPADRVPTGVLTGRLVNEEGGPVAGTVRFIFEGQYDMYRSGRAGEDGEFRIEYVPTESRVVQRGSRPGEETVLLELPGRARGAIHCVGDVRAN